MESHNATATENQLIFLFFLASLLISLFSSYYKASSKKSVTSMPKNRTCLNKYFLTYCYYG